MNNQKPTTESGKNSDIGSFKTAGYQLFHKRIRAKITFCLRNSGNFSLTTLLSFIKPKIVCRYVDNPIEIKSKKSFKLRQRPSLLSVKNAFYPRIWSNMDAKSPNFGLITANLTKFCRKEG